jgi:hypothetical protein
MARSPGMQIDRRQVAFYGVPSGPASAELAGVSVWVWQGFREVGTCVCPPPREGVLVWCLGLPPAAATRSLPLLLHPETNQGDELYRRKCLGTCPLGPFVSTTPLTPPHQALKAGRPGGNDRDPGAVTGWQRLSYPTGNAARRRGCWHCNRRTIATRALSPGPRQRASVEYLLGNELFRRKCLDLYQLRKFVSATPGTPPLSRETNAAQPLSLTGNACRAHPASGVRPGSWRRPFPRSFPRGEGRKSWSPS